MSTASVDETLSNDGELLKLFQQGDQTAFITIFNREVHRIWAFVNGIVKDPAATDKILDTVFYTLFHCRHQFRALDQVHSWLILNSRNTVIAYLKNGPGANILRLEKQEPLEGHQQFLRSSVFSIEYVIRQMGTSVNVHQDPTPGSMGNSNNGQQPNVKQTNTNEEHHSEKRTNLLSEQPWGIMEDN